MNLSSSKPSPVSSASDARSVAAQALAGVLGQGRALEDSLEPLLPRLADRRERALAQALAYGVMRWLPKLQALLAPLLRKSLKDRDIESLLLLGLYQLLEMRVPDYAATAATVEAARALEKPWAAGLINGVLRNFLRQRDTLLAQAERRPAARLAHPEWLLDSFRQDWPQHWEDIAQAGNCAPPMSLRVNARQVPREAYLQELRDAGLEAVPCAHAPQGLTLAEAQDPLGLPGFAQGRVSVQDPAAQLAARVLAVPPGARVLDACAAPGGKAAHILESVPDARLVAVEKSRERVGPLQQTLARLQLPAQIVCADAAQPETWWDGQAFERILLDAPCSGSGVIRRHPDIKYLRRPSDLPKLAARQSRLLDALWPLLATGGRLLYATCSLLAAENTRQIESFLARHADAEHLPIDAAWGRACAYGRQILPGEDGMDGFYYACLLKR